MKKLVSLLLVLMMVLAAVPAMAEFTDAEVFQRCIEFAEEAQFTYNADADGNFLSIGVAMDSAFSPNGCTMWMFAYGDGISIDIDYDVLVPEDRYNEMLILLSLINARSSEGHFYANPNSYRIGVTDYLYAVDRIPAVAMVNHVVSGLYSRLGYYDSLIAQVAGGASAWDVYNAFVAE